MPTNGIAYEDPGVKPMASWTNPSNSIQGAYGAAVNQQGEDYDQLMGQYRSLFDAANASRARNSVTNVPKVEAQQRTVATIPGYQRTGAMENVMGRLNNFADTGGYSDSDITAFRERGLSPIRSIYATALQNLRRQKALQGGYSPNFGAMQAKLAREQSGIIGQHTMDLNADIAERVQKGKEFGLSNLTPLAQFEQGQTDNINAQNASATNAVNNANVSDVNKANELNANFAFNADQNARNSDKDYIQQALAATGGAANLYGTTPALVNTFGNQVLASNSQNLQGQQAEANIRQARANTGVSLVNSGAMRTIPYGGSVRGAA